VTVRISPHKASKILQYFFRGVPQPQVAKECGVNQATVSRHASLFKADTDQIGIMAAARRYGIMHEVDLLRSLATELSKNRLTVEEARGGVSILKSFDSLGVSPKEHNTLVKVIAKLKTPDFVPAAMKLVRLENNTGRTYPEVVSHFEQLSSESIQLQQSNAVLKQENEVLRQSIEQLDTAKKGKEEELKELEQRAEQRRAAIEAEMAKRMNDANLTLDRIQRFEPMAKTLEKLGVSDDELEDYLKEHQKIEELGIGFENFKAAVEPVEAGIETIDADRFAKQLAEYGSLDKAIEVMGTEATSLRSELENSKGRKAKLEAEVERLSGKKTTLQEETGELKTLKQTLAQTIDVMESQRKQLEKYLPRLESSVETLEARKTALEKQAKHLEEKIEEMEGKLREVSRIDKDLAEKKETLAEVEAKISAAGSMFELFQSFVGFVGANESPEMEKFLESIPFLVETARQRKYNADFLKKYVVGRLTGDTLNMLTCSDCGIEFVIAGKSREGRRGLYARYEAERKCCPICGQRSTVFVNRNLSEVLKEELKGPPQV